MNNKEIYRTLQEETINRYQTRYYQIGEGPKTLGWGCREDQLERFENLCKYIDFSGETVMDLGCGFADFYGYLKERKILCNYIGVDVIPEFIKRCEEKYSEATFIQGNVLIEAEALPQADVVISTGTLNLKQTLIDNLLYTREFMQLAFLKANKKLALDFLSTQLTNNYPAEDFIYYHSPMKVMEIAFELTENVEIIHNYKPIPQKEFMCILTK